MALSPSAGDRRLLEYQLVASKLYEHGKDTLEILKAELRKIERKEERKAGRKMAAAK